MARTSQEASKVSATQFTAVHRHSRTNQVSTKATSINEKVKAGTFYGEGKSPHWKNKTDLPAGKCQLSFEKI
jgi:hypothetical protein